MEVRPHKDGVSSRLLPPAWLSPPATNQPHQKNYGSFSDSSPHHCTSSGADSSPTALFTFYCWRFLPIKRLSGLDHQQPYHHPRPLQSAPPRLHYVAASWFNQRRQVKEVNIDILLNINCEFKGVCSVHESPKGSRHWWRWLFLSWPSSSMNKQWSKHK